MNNNTDYDIFIKAYPDEEKASIRLFGDGFVKLIDCSPRIVPKDRTMEFRAVQSARVSYGRIVGDKSSKYTNGLKGVAEDRGLLQYLIRHKHTSPLESISFQFVLKVPIHVKNQIIRHRTGKFNEYSQRYNKVDLGFYEGEVRLQGNTHNKQSSDETMEVSDDAKKAWAEYVEHTAKTFELYNAVVESGIAREVARSHLPLSTFTILYFQMDLSNLLKFLRLRIEEGAQKEVRLVAQAIKDLITPLVPDAVAAFDNDFNSINFNNNDIEYLNNEKNNKDNNEEVKLEYKGSKSEKRELDAKRKTINI